MHDFLKEKIRARKGIVLNTEGIKIGTHEGTCFYTIGQKAGSHIGINIRKPAGESQKKFYVAEKNKGNILVVAPEGHSCLKARNVFIRKIHFINRKEKGNFSARIRHLGKLYPGKLEKKAGKWKFVFKKGIEGIASGQIIVVYADERVVASGEMKLDENKIK